MERIAHDGQDHTLLQPRLEEAESWERLDELLAEVNKGDRQRRSDLMVAHTAALFAGIESPPALDTWPIVGGASETTPRWIEMVVGIEIDRTILRMVENDGTCVDCLIVWVRHLIESRIRLSKWAVWDVDALLG